MCGLHLSSTGFVYPVESYLLIDSDYLPASAANCEDIFMKNLWIKNTKVHFLSVSPFSFVRHTQLSHLISKTHGSLDTFNNWLSLLIQERVSIETVGSSLFKVPILSCARYHM